MIRCRRTTLWIVAVTVWAVASTNAQHRMAMPDSTTYTVTAENGVPEIPFRLVNNHLILSLSVNGSEPLGVILDTGMPSPGLALHDSPSVEALDLEIDPAMQVRVAGAGGEGETFPAQLAMKESLTLPGLTIDDTPVIVLPAMHGVAGYHQGIIGYALFSRFVVELDYDEGLMRLHEPETYAPPAEAHVLPLTFRHRVPYVTLGVSLGGEEPFDAEVVVDLGATHAISLNADASERITVPEAALTTVLGRGVSGLVNGKVGRIGALDLAGAELYDVVTSFPMTEHQNPRGVDSLAGNLGSEVLRRFRTTFDYAGERMILEPNEAFDDPFLFDRSGVWLTPGERLEVVHVIADSPADQSGVQVGDVVTHVNGRPVGGEDYGDVRETMMATGEVRLSLERGEERLEATVTLRRLI